MWSKLQILNSNILILAKLFLNKKAFQQNKIPITLSVTLSGTSHSFSATIFEKIFTGEMNDVVL
jgi:hypothetical protein